MMLFLRLIRALTPPRIEEPEEHHRAPSMGIGRQPRIGRHCECCPRSGLRRVEIDVQCNLVNVTAKCLRLSHEATVLRHRINQRSTDGYAKLEHSCTGVAGQSAARSLEIPALLPRKRNGYRIGMLSRRDFAR